MDKREQRLTIAFCLGTMVATAIWWVGVFATDWVAPMTLGSAFGAKGLPLLLLGDMFSAVLIPLLILGCMFRLPQTLPALFWIHFGGQGYAFAVSIVGSVVDPRASLGMVAMFFSAGVAFVFAMRMSRMPILWGPFRFEDARPQSASVLTQKTLAQSAGMWAVFYGVIPLGVVAIESGFGFRRLPDYPPGVFFALLALFVGPGVVGLRAGVEMARRGEGTPLPSTGTKKLVVTGAYRWIRNPMAAVAVVQGVALGCLLRSCLVVAYALLGGVAWELLVRPLEEAHLESKFGEAYREYRARVRCWVPGVAG